MNKKQDRQGVRTPANIEQKYDLSRGMNDAEEAKQAATNAQRVAAEATQIASAAKTVAEEAKQIAENGVSGGGSSGGITHEWNGTVLIVTSDSGTSSADLKGDTGATGASGANGVGITNIRIEEVT